MTIAGWARIGVGGGEGVRAGGFRSGRWVGVGGAGEASGRAEEVRGSGQGHGGGCGDWAVQLWRAEASKGLVAHGGHRGGQVEAVMSGERKGRGLAKVGSVRDGERERDKSDNFFHFS